MAAFPNYYVLLSCAVDTHSGFGGDLLNALGVVEFRTTIECEQEELERNVIEAAMASVVILSKRYLSFPSCLDKLAEISEGSVGRLFLPVLHDVKPSDVEHQIDSYRNSVEPENFKRWIQALTKVLEAVPHFTPCHFQRDGDTFVYRCIEKIVQVILIHAASTIGQDPQEKEVIQLLNFGSEDGVRVVGIGGDPRIGKRVARRVFDLVAGEGFDSYCFLNVEENLRGQAFGHFKSIFSSGMVANNPGISITKSTLNRMKVFVVFPGINDPNWLKYALELINEFGSGSKVIVTSQNIGLLQGVYQVERPDRTASYVNVGDSAEIRASGHSFEQEYGGMRDAQPASADRSRNWDPMELEYQLSSSSSSLDAL